jgi:hypothetical protein
MIPIILTTINFLYPMPIRYHTLSEHCDSHLIRQYLLVMTVISTLSYVVNSCSYYHQAAAICSVGVIFPYKRYTLIHKYSACLGLFFVYLSITNILYRIMYLYFLTSFIVCLFTTYHRLCYLLEFGVCILSVTHITMIC